MACLNKLAIRGIRSFDDKQLSVIEFFSPVTVIVGHNGSGKTTIIECLKYATTGDQPPNTRGGAFVHDPKIANEKEVKAQVKLRFHAANGKRMLAVRNLSVTVKKTGLTMKTLESILALADENAEKAGKRVVISTKCAEMDNEIPQLLGVSKAVLENVIFCHQEDSYWPLAEPSALKKKFDDIFEATRYTKALASITTLRKERVGELKVEKERLVGFSKEKASADKLKSRISDLSNTIAVKEVEHEKTKIERDKIAESNRRFVERGTQFREIYVKYDNLTKTRDRCRTQLEEERGNVQEVSGTDEELAQKINNHDKEVAACQQRKRAEEMKQQRLEDEQRSLDKLHVQLVQQHGGLISEAKNQEVKIRDRETIIHELGDKYSIKGFNHSQLDSTAILQFLSKFGDMQRKQATEFEQLKADLHTKQEEFNSKRRQLDGELEAHRLRKQVTRDQMAKHQQTISDGNRQLEDQATIPSQLQNAQDEIHEKKRRIEKIKADIATAAFEKNLAEKGEKARQVEERHQTLSSELASLSLQSDSRAKLDLKRGEVKSRTIEIQAIVDNANVRHREQFGGKLKPETISNDVERVHVAKEREFSEAETEYSRVNNQLQRAETTLSSLKSSLTSKKQEIARLEKKIKGSLEAGQELDTCIREASGEVEWRKQSLSGSGIYETLLKTGRTEKKCGTCQRHMNKSELQVYEKTLNDFIKTVKEADTDTVKSELVEWEEELERLQKLKPLQVAIAQLEKEIPSIQSQIKEEETNVSQATREVEEAMTTSEAAKSLLNELTTLKQQTITIARLQKDVEKAKIDTVQLEADLSNTGFVKTADDVQEELSSIAAERQAIDKERQTLLNERERHNQALATAERGLHTLELQEQTLSAELAKKTLLEEQVANARKEITSSTATLRELDAKIAAAQAPVDALVQEFQGIRLEMEAKIQRAEAVVQDLNIRADRLNRLNKDIEQYAKGRGKMQLAESQARIDETEARRQQILKEIDTVRAAVEAFQKEIYLSQVTVNNLQKNLTLRKLVREIADIQRQIEEINIEEMAKNRRNFEEQYAVLKTQEETLQNDYMRLGGELTSMKSQLRGLEDDMQQHKGIHKLYTDQLIKVKMSDMANNDLEKYGKALDHAIMKYHTLKMEEVNDTMKHLWNKTYQGTDIDGIKIRSDVEGGTSKRSYNYRVVMTKDQVEMDMRGRCSAGQKMLASIIIRLALSDSFGQNCGILALDEPTNALDTENIDALAESLVDIINERKNHSAFQLIIITHDENFLRKLGHSDVMEYYWRVSRDSRQKSVIERQRFR
ncbi:hypothetical protein BDN72DRAFT_963073 [Pluteus cervinus]|uniref:Uncharacterized protein n=1 Tax=Pluteus cervinus TaxID=181527 RepID=A0ACD3AH67_9AGAR|nr:hypothetical protein BDN72DRAFT_963073 [Pluteus cervinus]